MNERNCKQKEHKVKKKKEVVWLKLLFNYDSITLFLNSSLCGQIVY